MPLIKNDISKSFRTFSFGAPVTTGAPSFGICSEPNSFFDNFLKQMKFYNDDTNKTIRIDIALYNELYENFIRVIHHWFGSRNK